LIQSCPIDRLAFYEDNSRLAAKQFCIDFGR